MVAQILGTDEDETLKVLRSRLSKIEDSSQVTRSLMSLDGGMDFMDRKESDELRKRQREIREKERQEADFSNTFATKARELRLAKEAKEPKDTGKKRRKGPPSSKVVEGSIPQATVRAYMPPGCYVWRDRVRGGWCAHPDCTARVSSSWSAHGGEREALMALFRCVWATYLRVTGQDVSACPIEGVFSSAPASSSASSSDAFIPGLGAPPPPAEPKAKAKAKAKATKKK